MSVLSRITSTASAPRGLEKVPVLRSDYSFSSLVDVFEGQDAVVSAIATLDVTQQHAIVDAAAAAGVKRFLPSEFGGDTSAEDVGDIAAFAKGKQELVEHVRSKEAGGLT